MINLEKLCRQTLRKVSESTGADWLRVRAASAAASEDPVGSLIDLAPRVGRGFAKTLLDEAMETIHVQQMLASLDDQGRVIAAAASVAA